MRKEYNITFLPLAPPPPLILDAKFLTARRILCAQTLWESQFVFHFKTNEITVSLPMIEFITQDKATLLHVNYECNIVQNGVMSSK
jgi:hypothetical protein